MHAGLPEGHVLLEVADLQSEPMIEIDMPATFSKEFNDAIQEDAIAIIVGGQKIGYVNRGLIPTMEELIDKNRIVGAWVEKTNGAPGRPTAYLYVKVSAS